MNFDFLITSLIVVLIPGTGVIYTISIGMSRGFLMSIIAAFGCTLGIIPALLASILGLGAIMHTSAVLFEALRYAGIIYLLYLAYKMWGDDSLFEAQKDQKQKKFKIMMEGFLINILNPKLTIFFLAFLPQFISANTASPIFDFAYLGFIFMLMTFAVFIFYGFFAHQLARFILSSKRAKSWMQKIFAAAFAGMAAKLWVSE